MTYLYQPLPNQNDFSINYIKELQFGHIVCIAENPGLGKKVFIMDPYKSPYFIQPRPFKKFKIKFVRRFHGLIAVGGIREGSGVVYLYQLVLKIHKFKTMFWFLDLDISNLYSWKLKLIKKIKVKGDPLKLMNIENNQYIIISSGVNYNYFSLYNKYYELERIFKLNKNDYYDFKYSTGVLLALSKSEKVIKAFHTNKNFTLFQKLNHGEQDIRFMTILHNRSLMTISSNGYSKLWKYRNETLMEFEELKLDTEDSQITSILLLKNGCLVIGLEKGNIKIFNPYETFKLLHNLNSGSSYPITSLHQTKKGRIISGDEKGDVKVWAHYSLMKNFKRFFIEFQIYYFYLIILTTILYCDLI